MNTIGQLLARDLSEPIEEVVKLDQQDEPTVYNEIREYIATVRIRQDYRDVLEAIADAPSNPTEGVGVWVSGFFGSGKSSFAKNLGYILGNRTVSGHSASQLFVEQLEKHAPNGDLAVRRITDLLNFIRARFDTQVLMFDVQKDRAVRRATEPIAEVMYTVLLRELDYAQDYDLAELEIELEAEGRLASFVKTCAQLHGETARSARGENAAVPLTLTGVSPDIYAIWRQVRKGAQRTQRTSAVMHAIDPAIYPTADSWATTGVRSTSDITIRTLVDRTFDLTARRRPGHAIFFIIDEVGQYIARSAEKIEDLRAVVEHFGQESKNRVLSGRAPAPAWIIVTSQEKLDEVVAAIDDKRVELARLQDRFKHQIDMAPADIREVATKRVLAKTEQAESFLKRLYNEKSAVLRTHTRMERTNRQLDISREDFVQFYPYLPYLVMLSIDIVSGTRLQHAEAPRHIGGSNRTIIKQAYEMLVGDRTKLANAPIGELVTLDRIYDLVEGNLSSNTRRDIGEIEQLPHGDVWTVRTAKAIALLTYVRDLPSTPINLAALLYRNLNDDSALPHVERAIELLQTAQFIRQTESGWKLQTAQEKHWATERNAMSPTQREANELLADALRGLFSAPTLTRYRFQDLKNFRVDVTWDGRALTTGNPQIPLLLKLADDADDFNRICEGVRTDSRTSAHVNDIFWVMGLNSEIDELVVEVHRSRRMVAKYEQLRAQGKLGGDEATSLSQEKSDGARWEARLADRLERALTTGRGYFRGVQRDGAQLGNNLSEIFRSLFDYAVPDLYPNLELGARPLTGNEPSEILRAANLNGLDKVFYDPPTGLELVVKEGMKYVVNLNAPIIKEVTAYLEREHSYGNKVTGRTLETHFSGLGYGWDQEILWLVLATLLRGGAIEVTYQGRRYRNHLDPQARAPFTGANAFRSASFAPRKAPDLRTLVDAARRFEELTGDEVDVEESAIAQAFQNLARNELQQLLPLEATVRANHIPVAGILQEYHNTLDSILSSASDDCVNILAGEGTSFQKMRERVAVIRRGTDQRGLVYLQRLRTAAEQIWPALQLAELDDGLGDAAALLRNALAEGNIFDASTERNQALSKLETTYNARYKERHEARTKVFKEAIDVIRGQLEWPQLPEALSEQLLKPLISRTCTIEKSAGELRCPSCGASLAEMASDIAAVDKLRSDILLRMQELLAPEEKIERVRITKLVGAGRMLDDDAAVTKVLAELEDYLRKLVASGVKIILE